MIPYRVAISLPIFGGTTHAVLAYLATEPVMRLTMIIIAVAYLTLGALGIVLAARSRAL